MRSAAAAAPLGGGGGRAFVFISLQVGDGLAARCEHRAHERGVARLERGDAARVGEFRAAREHEKVRLALGVLIPHHDQAVVVADDPGGRVGARARVHQPARPRRRRRGRSLRRRRRRRLRRLRLRLRLVLLLRLRRAHHLRERVAARFCFFFGGENDAASSDAFPPPRRVGRHSGRDPFVRDPFDDPFASTLDPKARPLFASGDGVEAPERPLRVGVVPARDDSLEPLPPARRLVRLPGKHSPHNLNPRLALDAPRVVRSPPHPAHEFARGDAHLDGDERRAARPREVRERRALVPREVAPIDGDAEAERQRDADGAKAPLARAGATVRADRVLVHDAPAGRRELGAERALPGAGGPTRSATTRGAAAARTAGGDAGFFARAVAGSAAAAASRVFAGASSRGRRGASSSPSRVRSTTAAGFVARAAADGAAAAVRAATTRMLPGARSSWKSPRPSPSRSVASSPLRMSLRACACAAGNHGVGFAPRLVTRSVAPSAPSGVTSHCTRETLTSSSRARPRRGASARPIFVGTTGDEASAGGERQRRAVARHDERHRRGRRTRPKPRRGACRGARRVRRHAGG